MTFRKPNLIRVSIAFCIISKICSSFCGELPEVHNFKANGVSLTCLPPVDPAVLAYLADHLEPKECGGLCSFLALQNIKSHPPNKPTDTKSKNGLGFIPLLGDKAIKSYPCHHNLNLWNENIAVTEAENRLDGAEYVESILIFGLKQINRGDLASWMERLGVERRHFEISEMKEEWESHRKSGSESSKNSTSKFIQESLGQEIDIEEDIPSQMFCIIVLAIIGLVCTILIGILIWYCSKRKPAEIRHKSILLEEANGDQIERRTSTQRHRPRTIFI